jgi:hypothetical protein
MVLPEFFHSQPRLWLLKSESIFAVRKVTDSLEVVASYDPFFHTLILFINLLSILFIMKYSMTDRRCQHG